MQEFYNIYEKNILHTISDNLRKYREIKGFSQEILAEKVECSREYINKLENKKEDVSLKMLIKLTYVLDISMGEILN